MKVPIPYVTNLKDFYEDINDTLSYFITFRVQNGSQSIISNVTIPFCRFRPMEDSKELIEVRSCDCNGSLCGHPPQKLYVSEDQLENYIFVEQINLHFIFVYNVLANVMQ